MSQLPTKQRWMMATALVLVVIFAMLISWAVYTFFTVERGMVIYRLESEASRLASTLFFEKMTALAQLAIALIAGMWAFLTLAETTVHVKGRPTITCFALANLSLACSLLVYVYGYDFIVARIFYHGTFDIDAPLVVFVKETQQFFFLKGVIDLGFTIILGKHP
jgi:hypothetical protein